MLEVARALYIHYIHKRLNWVDRIQTLLVLWVGKSQKGDDLYSK